MRRLRRLLLQVVGLLAGASHARTGRQPARVLVVKPDHLGDLLLLTPALRELRAGLPHAHIALMVGPWSEAAIRGCPWVDSVLFCPFPGFTRGPKPGPLQPYTLLLRMALLLRAGHYDVALIARDDHWWGALLTLVAGIPQRIGHAVPEVAPLLTDALPYDLHQHVTRQALDLVAHLTGKATVRPPAMSAPIVVEDERWAENWLAAHGVDGGERLLAIHPGSGGQAKLWPAARWSMVADEMMARGWQVILTGGITELGLVDAIVHGLAKAPLVICGEASLGALAALYRRCDLVLGSDSGPLHLAAAAGVVTVVLFGPVDERRFGPWGPAERHRVVRSGLWCSPCGSVDACPRGTRPAECMTTISVSHVLAAIDRHGQTEPVSNGSIDL